MWHLKLADSYKCTCYIGYHTLMCLLMDLKKTKKWHLDGTALSTITLPLNGMT